MDAMGIAAVATAGIGTVTFSCIVGGIVLRDTFKTKKSCAKEQVHCKTNICDKIDGLKKDIQSQISAIDKKREDVRKENTMFMQAVYKHMGEVERYMKDHTL